MEWYVLKPYKTHASGPVYQSCGLTAQMHSLRLTLLNYNQIINLKNHRIQYGRTLNTTLSS